MNDQTLQKIGRTVRTDYADIAGNCRAIARTLKDIAATQYSVTLDVREVQMGERRDTHFVNTIAPTEYTEHPVDSEVLVDAALDQYCTENQWRDGIRVDFGPRQRLPEVAIFPPEAEERHVWYYAPNDPNPGRDVLTGQELTD